MGCRAGLWRVGGEAFAWCCGRWHRGGARVQRVGMAGLECCVEVARFLRGGLGSWWGLHAVVGLARFEGRCTVEWWGFEDPACGEKRSLQHWSEKKRKKEEKKHNFTYVPASAGNGGSGCGG